MGRSTDNDTAMLALLAPQNTTSHTEVEGLGQLPSSNTRCQMATNSASPNSSTRALCMLLSRRNKLSTKDGDTSQASKTQQACAASGAKWALPPKWLEPDLCSPPLV